MSRNFGLHGTNLESVPEVFVFFYLKTQNTSGKMMKDSGGSFLAAAALAVFHAAGNCVT